MGAKLETTVTDAMGVPSTDVTRKYVPTGVTVSGVLDANSTYRFTATSDMYFNLDTTANPADDNDSILFGNVPEIFSTSANEVVVNLKAVVASGDFRATRMKSSG